MVAPHTMCVFEALTLRAMVSFDRTDGFRPARTDQGLGGVAESLFGNKSAPAGHVSTCLSYPSE